VHFEAFKFNIQNRGERKRRTSTEKSIRSKIAKIKWRVKIMKNCIERPKDFVIIRH